MVHQWFMVVDLDFQPTGRSAQRRPSRWWPGPVSLSGCRHRRVASLPMVLEFFVRSNLVPAVPWKKGSTFFKKESCLPTIIFSCQFSEEYWSIGSYYLRSSPPLAAGAFPSRILWWSRHWFDLGSIAMDFTETSQGRFLETKVLFTHLDSMEKLWAKLLSPFLYSRGQSSKTTLFTGCFMKTQHLAFKMA